MRTKASACSRKRIAYGGRQRGVAAIEVAFMLPLLVGTSYAAIVYSYTYLLQQSLNNAVQQATQAAVAVVPPLDSQRSTYDANVLRVVTQTKDRVLNWLPEEQKARVSESKVSASGAAGQALVASCGDETGALCATYSLQFDMLGSSGGMGAFFPQVRLFNMAFPPLPNVLRATSVARLT